MNLNQLKMFHLAVKSGSLSAAARTLSVSQPAVTKALKKLQDYYGIKLILNSGNGITTTTAGDELFEITENLFSLEADAEELLDSYMDAANQRLNIASSESFGAYYLPDIIETLSDHFPDAEITLEMGTTDFVIEQIKNRQADIGFTSYRQTHPLLLFLPSFEENLQIICHPAHPIAQTPKIHPTDLNGCRLVRHEPGSFPHKTMSQLIEKYQLNVDARQYSLTSSEAIKAMVQKNLGVAIISQKTIAKELELGLLKAVDIDEPLVQRRFYICLRRNKVASKMLHHLTELCSSQ